MSHLRQDKAVLDKIAELLFELDRQQLKPPPSPKPQPKPVPSPSGDRLYQKQKQYDMRLQHMRRLKQKQQEKNLTPFQISNKKTISINKKKPTKPIEQRAKDIMMEKQKRVLDHKIKTAEEKRLKEDQEVQEIQKYMEQKGYDDNRRLDLEAFMEKQKEYNMRKLQNLNTLSLQQLQKHIKNSQQPTISPSSSQLLKTKPQLAAMSFLERQKWHEQNRRQSQARLQMQIDAQVMPFQPNILDRQVRRNHTPTPQSKSKSQKQRSSSPQSSRSINKKTPTNSRSKRILTQPQPPMDMTFSPPRTPQTASRVPSTNKLNNKKMVPALKPSKSATKVKQPVKHFQNHYPSENNYQKDDQQYHEPHFSYSPSTQIKHPKSYEPSQQQLTANRQRNHLEGSNLSSSRSEKQTRLRELIFRHRTEVLKFIEDLAEKQGVTSQ